MKPIVDEIARKLRDALQESMEDFEGLYVFGSQVRGDATEDSDVDIVIILGNDYFLMPEPLADIWSQIMYDYYDIIDIDLHRQTRQKLEMNPFFHDEVVNKGVFYGTT